MNEIIKSYKALVPLLGQFLGPCYEVILMDLTSDNNGIVAIANGEVTGRSVGDPISTDAIRILLDREYDSGDSLMNYTNVLDDGRVLRSLTFFIKDRGETVGLFGINFDDSPYRDLTRKLMTVIHPDEFVSRLFDVQSKEADARLLSIVQSGTSAERIRRDPEQVMQEMFRQVTTAYKTPSERLTPSERETVVRALNKCGMFSLKGSVQYTADRLGCSIATVYRYIQAGRAQQ